MLKYTKNQSKTDLPRREKLDNKSHGGKALIIAGSQGMWGAAVLSATAAARVGAGYVYIFEAKNKIPISKTPDFLFIKKIKNASIFNAIAVGPGLSGGSYIQAWLKKIQKLPYVVVDASALSVLAKLKKFKIPKTWILTPHEGELAQMLGVDSKKIKNERLKYLEIAQKKFGCIVLLKGSGTLISNGKDLVQITTGNPALAKAGTGDVLTGMIAGFLSQKVEPMQAACLSAYLHGKMADDWCAQGNDVLSLMASDLLERISVTLKNAR